MNSKLLVLLILGGFASAAAAQTAPVEPTLEPGAAAIGADASDSKPQDRNCLTQTGSRITANENWRAERAGKPADKCANVSGRSYSREDIERTGAIDVRDALRRLDTSVH
jgi:hypothetical protein